MSESAKDPPFFLSRPSRPPSPAERAALVVSRQGLHRSLVRHFAASITHMDDEIGRVVEALERTGKRQNTVIIFSSDNGGQQNWLMAARDYNGRYAPHTTLGSNTPLRGWKTEVYEGGIGCRHSSTGRQVCRAGRRSTHRCT